MIARETFEMNLPCCFQCLHRLKRTSFARTIKYGNRNWKLLLAGEIFSGFCKNGQQLMQHRSSPCAKIPEAASLLCKINCDQEWGERMDVISRGREMGRRWVRRGIDQCDMTRWTLKLILQLWAVRKTTCSLNFTIFASFCQLAQTEWKLMGPPQIWKRLVVSGLPRCHVKQLVTNTYCVRTTGFISRVAARDGSKGSGGSHGVYRLKKCSF